MNTEKKLSKIRKAATAGFILLGMSAFHSAFAQNLPSQDGMDPISSSLPAKGVLGKTILQNHGGTNSGGSTSGSITFQSWCSEAEQILDKAQKIANVKYAAGNLIGARETLVNGLYDALQSAQNQSSIMTQPSLTLRLLERGLKIATAIQQAAPYEVDEQVRVLQDYYRFARETSTNLDLPFYNPIQYAYLHHLPNPVFDRIEFERRYERYAKSQIEWLVGVDVPGQQPKIKFVVPCHDQYAKINQKCVLGSSEIFFKLAEIITADVAEDLDYLLVSASYQCVIGELKNDNELLAEFNVGDHSNSGDEGVFLNITLLPDFEKFINHIHNRCGPI